MPAGLRRHKASLNIQSGGFLIFLSILIKFIYNCMICQVRSFLLYSLPILTLRNDCKIESWALIGGAALVEYSVQICRLVLFCSVVNICGNFMVGRVITYAMMVIGVDCLL